MPTALPPAPSNTKPTTQVIEGIRAIMTLAPAAGYALAAVIFYFGYKIDEKHVLHMQDEIAARKTAEAATV